ncbi:MAG TPA: hypothetical protein VIF09_22135 [Polyangiaceae bacterium]|jgi:hypothetical protein
MRFVFHVMLGVSVAITTAGIALGLEVRDELVSSHLAAHTSPTHRVSAERLDVEQALPPPLPVSPRYGAEVGTSAILSWRLTEATDGARVELCPTSDFDEARTRHIDVTGEELRLPPTWPTGVWYWRLRGRQDGAIGDRATPTWMLFVNDGSTPS